MRDQLSPSSLTGTAQQLGNLNRDETSVPFNPNQLDDVIPFNRPFLTGNEQHYVNEAISAYAIASDGKHTKACEGILQRQFDIKRALFVTSCTSALEMAAMLCELQPGDEVIMPSYTFVSTANAFVREGASPVFVDIRKDTMNLDEDLIEKAITARTKAIAPVHYAGMPCEMDRIMQIADEHGLIVVEDAAQAVHSYTGDQALGSIGHLGAYSFHETKNYVCGEGGALCVNDERFLDRAEIIREKGTNRKQFMRGVVDKYTWVDKGSSFINSEMSAAFLRVQLESLDLIRDVRGACWHRYHDGLKPLSEQGLLTLPIIPANCSPNYHMFQILLPSEAKRNSLMAYLRGQQINAVFHYIPLHTAPMGRKFGYESGMLPATEDLASRVLRLPLYGDLNEAQQARIIQSITEFLSS